MNACRTIVGWKVLGILCSAGALSLAGATGAAAAELDRSFGTTGRVVSDFGHTEARASALALAPDGSLLVAGSECSLPAAGGRSCDLALIQYGTDGSELRRTPGGFAAHPDFVVNDLAVDFEGGALAVGRRYSLGWSPDLVRYQPDGSADPAFSAAALPPAFAVKEITAVEVDASNRVLLAGESTQHEVLIARLGPDGAADESFGGDGVATLQQPGPPYVSALALGTEGRIFLAGSLQAGDPEAGDVGAVLIAALESNGEPAAGFSAPASFGPELPGVRDLKLDGLGRLLLSLEGNDAKALPVVRLLSTGALDESFGRDGIATMPSCEECGVATALAVDGSDRPLFAGSPFRLGRYTTAGMADDGLVRGGSFTVDFGEGSRLEANDLAIDGAGRVVVAGSRIAADGHSQFILARLLVDGGPVSACRGVAATVVGTPGDDVLVGTTGRDVILALGSADEIRGLGGGDLICAGSSADVVRGGAGRDRIYGYAGTDRVLGGAGTDFVSGTNGADQIKGGTGRDRLLGGAGRDVIQGGAGADLLHGSGAADRLLGQAGRDRLFGGAGDDILAGGAGKDLVRGGRGRNRAHG